jgi:DNA-binding MarR family transcriptional regulator
MFTQREREVLEVLRGGIHTPSAVAQELEVTVSAISQLLAKLEAKGAVTRTRVGRSVRYEVVPEAKGEAIDHVYAAYEALAEVWRHVLQLDLTREELKAAREARNHLEGILTHKEKRRRRGG